MNKAFERFSLNELMEKTQQLKGNFVVTYAEEDNSIIVGNITNKEIDLQKEKIFLYRENIKLKKLLKLYFKRDMDG